MNIRHLLFSLVLLPLLAVADDTETIGAVIDDFHDAAAYGDKDRYLDHLTADAVFVGTDEWERWPKQPEFTDYVGSRFHGGAGWNYHSVERHIRIADSGDVAWFDEVLYSEQNGRFRGTGVLVKDSRSWKIAHYAMSFLILNENWPAVIELTKKTLAEKENSEPAR